MFSRSAIFLSSLSITYVPHLLDLCAKTRGRCGPRYYSRMSKRKDDIPRERGAAGNERRIHAWAAAWGLAEGTFFFIVPDVWLSWVALQKPRTARKAALSALAGAMAGGAFVHAWTRRMDAPTTR